MLHRLASDSRLLSHAEASARCAPPLQRLPQRRSIRGMWVLGLSRTFKSHVVLLLYMLKPNDPMHAGLG